MKSSNARTTKASKSKASSGCLYWTPWWCEVFDVAVDIRKGSPTFGQWVGHTLSAANKRQLFVPAGLAHGFCVTSETAEFVYKCSDFYDPEDEGGLIWSGCPGVNCFLIGLALN